MQKEGPTREGAENKQREEEYRARLERLTRGSSAKMEPMGNAGSGRDQSGTGGKKEKK